MVEEQKTESGQTVIASEDIGVVWVQSEAEKLGYRNGDPKWANFGQGEPEVGKLEGGKPRIKEFKIHPEDNRYGPVNGMEELRTSIADYYNRLYRQKMKSQYTFKNVSIAMGGRAALSRIFAILAPGRMGFRIPEYPAYHDLMNLHEDKITPVCIATKKENNFSILPCEFQETLCNEQLDTFLFSNPCNPTGHVLRDTELLIYVESAKRMGCMLIVDEFYSHYIYENSASSINSVSASAFIDDVNTENVLIVDGLTKSFRYPGWRLAWVLGPEKIIEELGRVGSAIDGGPSMPVQRAALPLFKNSFVDTEMPALRKTFSRKQNLMKHMLHANGIECSADANGTFYVWGNISKLPYPINDSSVFFREALKRKVITVPGYLFDIHCGKQTTDSDFNHYIRFSFGPDEENLVMGLDRITELINSFTIDDSQR